MKCFIGRYYQKSFSHKTKKCQKTNNHGFFKSKRENLIMVNYTINQDILTHFLPKGTELDLYKNKCFISLVGFMFKKTKVKGIAFPFHQNFEEINLRFYVKSKEGKETKRGVVFIKEIIPKKLISIVANTIYKEHYFTTKINHNISTKNDILNVSFDWINKGVKQSSGVISELCLNSIKINSVEEFIAEHYWGYTKVNDKKTSSYEVKHPSWKQHKVTDFNLNLNFEENYGKSFECLDQSEPHSVFLFNGSEISIGNKQKIK